MFEVLTQDIVTEYKGRCQKKTAKLTLIRSPPEMLCQRHSVSIMLTHLPVFWDLASLGSVIERGTKPSFLVLKPITSVPPCAKGAEPSFLVAVLWCN